MELLARLEAIARRGKPQPRQPEVIEMGALRVNCQTRCAQRDGALVDLSAKDFDLLVLFLRNVGRLLSRAEIRETVWGPRAPFSSRTLDTHVSRIRDRLGLTPSHGWRLAAVYGYGYRLQHITRSTGDVGGDDAMRGSLRLYSALEQPSGESTG
jgi:DNA-binding response OmpR family regulator